MPNPRLNIGNLWWYDIGNSDTPTNKRNRKSGVHHLGQKIPHYLLMYWFHRLLATPMLQPTRRSILHRIWSANVTKPTKNLFCHIFQNILFSDFRQLHRYMSPPFGLRLNIPLPVVSRALRWYRLGIWTKSATLPIDKFLAQSCRHLRKNAWHGLNFIAVAAYLSSGRMWNSMWILQTSFPRGSLFGFDFLLEGYFLRVPVRKF